MNKYNLVQTKKGCTKQIMKTPEGGNHRQKLCWESPFLRNGWKITCIFEPTFSFTRCHIHLPNTGSSTVLFWVASIYPSFALLYFSLLFLKVFLLVSWFDVEHCPRTITSPVLGLSFNLSPSAYPTTEKYINCIGTNRATSGNTAC